MEKDVIFRIEARHPKYAGIGLYGVPIINIDGKNKPFDSLADFIFDSTEYTERHPDPKEEFYFCYNKDLRFGFSNLEQLTRWVNAKELKLVSKYVAGYLDFAISVYLIPKSRVTHGETQCAWRKMSHDKPFTWIECSTMVQLLEEGTVNKWLGPHWIEHIKKKETTTEYSFA